VAAGRRGLEWAADPRLVGAAPRPTSRSTIRGSGFLKPRPRGSCRASGALRRDRSGPSGEHGSGARIGYRRARAACRDRAFADDSRSRKTALFGFVPGCWAATFRAQFHFRPRFLTATEHKCGRTGQHQTRCLAGRPFRFLNLPVETIRRRVERLKKRAILFEASVGSFGQLMVRSFTGKSVVCAYLEAKPLLQCLGNFPADS
jgi:hypothetical protein